MDSAFAKHDRARKHLDELRVSVNAFRDADVGDAISTRLRYPFGEDDRRAVLTLRVDLKAPMDWSLIMGDILTNLRAALDHAVFGHASERQHLNSAQRRELKHPTCLDRRDWDGPPAASEIDGWQPSSRPGARYLLEGVVEPGFLTFIEENQPFNFKDAAPAWHPMAILNGLVNRDKHRVLLDVPINVADVILGKNNMTILSEGRPKFFAGGVEKELVVLRALRPDGAAPAYRLVLMQADALFMEEIEIPGTGERRPFLQLMERLVNTIGDYLALLRAAGC